MSGGNYRDQEVFSPNRRYRLTAQSADNLPGGHGQARDFEYRMWLDGSLLWERSAPTSEPSPLEIILSDDGFAILHLHHVLRSPRVLALDPQGRELLQLAVDTTAQAHGWDGLLWRVREMLHSTAGDFWTRGSWPYFLTYRGNRHFVCRAKSGQRLILRLVDPTVLPENEIEENILNAEESAAAVRCLAVTGEQLLQLKADDDTAWDLDAQLGRCLNVLSAHLPPESAEWLLKLEHYDDHLPNKNTSEIAMEVNWMRNPRARIQWLLPPSEPDRRRPSDLSI